LVGCGRDGGVDFVVEDVMEQDLEGVREVGQVFVGLAKGESERGVVF